MTSALPIVYSFRRCPFAMRARLALVASGTRCVIREVVLRDKPEALRLASPKATVPVLVTPQGSVIDESLDIMRWALGQNDPGQWLQHGDAARVLIAHNDGPFKQMLDQYKYPGRHGGANPEAARAAAARTLGDYDARLARTGWLNGTHVSLADMAILPFVRQFAHVDRGWFASQPWPHLQQWLDAFLASALFDTVMLRLPAWTEGDAPTIFPVAATAQFGATIPDARH